MQEYPWEDCLVGKKATATGEDERVSIKREDESGTHILKFTSIQES
jgi:hypothetical protein